LRLRNGDELGVARDVGLSRNPICSLSYHFASTGDDGAERELALFCAEPRQLETSSHHP
jgi:hypothetical protein